jgi:hypothetical protein
MRRGITMSMPVGTVALALALVLALAGPAQAKGIQSATITGPGLDELLVAPGDGLASLTAFWEVMPGQPQPPTLTDQAPTKQLGPRYRLTWRLTTHADRTTAIHQDLYPHAEGGPLVHTAAGQPIFNAGTVGGWYQAPVALRDRLNALGVPPAASDPVEAVDAVPSSNDSPWRAVIVLVAGAAALAGLGAAVAVRRARRRERVAPVPL